MEMKVIRSIRHRFGLRGANGGLARAKEQVSDLACLYQTVSRPLPLLHIPYETGSHACRRITVLSLISTCIVIHLPLIFRQACPLL